MPGRILVVVSTWRKTLIRVITAFDALKAMKRVYIVRKEICMEQTLKVPEFKTERDEAQWWVENQDQLAQQFERAAAEGKLGRGTVARRGNTPTTTIRLDPEDIAKARFHAERKRSQISNLFENADSSGASPGRISRRPKHSA
jgi:hypothetical protein